MTTSRRLPLHRWHEERGALFEPWLGHRVPVHYGDVEAELRSLDGGVGLFDRSPFARLELLGEDRLRFLNGLITCRLAPLEPGQGSYGFLTLQKGQVLADVAIWALEDRLFLDLPPGRAAAVSEHLAKYVVADRVEILPLDELIPLTLIGPGARALIGDAASELEAPWSHRKVTVADTEVHLCRHELVGEPAWICFASASIADLLASDLIEERGVRPVGYAAWERWRVARGVPLWGIDFGDENLPQETGLEEMAVAYDKGCYLGQEVVARLHYRGQVPRQLRRLRLDEGELPEPGTEVSFEGRAAGRVTSAARTAHGEGVALAILQRRAFEPGTRVEVEATGEATVAFAFGSTDSAGGSRGA